MTDEKGLKLVSGLVKWFDPTKGYGFILNEEGGADILLHANVLRNFGQATEVVSIEPPISDGSAPIADLDNGIIEHLEALPLRPARVKWFDKAKGFGFANIFGHPDDVFLHVEVLRHSGFADLAIGEAIGIRVVEGPRGLMAAQVTSWDRGTEQGASSLADENLGDQVQDIKDFMAHVAE